MQPCSEQKGRLRASLAQTASVSLISKSQPVCLSVCYLRAHSSDPRYLATDGYYELLDDAFRSVDYRQASAFISHMYTELARVHCPGPRL